MELTGFNSFNQEKLMLCQNQQRVPANIWLDLYSNWHSTYRIPMFLSILCTPPQPKFPLQIHVTHSQSNAGLKPKKSWVSVFHILYHQIILALSPKYPKSDHYLKPLPPSPSHPIFLPGLLQHQPRLSLSYHLPQSICYRAK